MQPAELAADLRAHRPGAVGDLLAQFGREIQGVAYLILRNHQDAEEIVIDTLLTAWKRSGDLRDDTALRAWLHRIATRHALSRRRRQRPVQSLDPSVSAPAAPGSQPSLDRLIVAEAMSGLPPQIRAAVALHHYAGLTVPEVAEAMGKSQNTVKSQLRIGLARLRTALAEPASTPTPERTGTDARRA
ncbi:MAG: RNA polymerase sigma factor [Chloroflexi bacterium]|nr:RNA polymerase sigma factor [Chloroflexota bacterium]